MKILFAAGGTGGHINPALAAINAYFTTRSNSFILALFT